MFLFQVIMMALRGLRANLLRSFLATLGVIIGVGAVISAMSILEGSQRDIVDSLESLGSETIFVSPALVRSGGRAVGVAQTLTVGDADALNDKRECPAIKAAVPEVSAKLLVKYFSRNKLVDVFGTSEAYAAIHNYEPIAGSFFSRDHVIAEHKVAVLGYQVKQDLFGNTPAVGRSIRIKGVSFRVVGVMARKGNIGFREVDDQVLVPVTTAMKRLLGIRFVHAISVQSDGQEKVNEAIQQIKRVLRRRHDIQIRHGKQDDFNITSMEEQRERLGEVMTIMQVVLYSIAVISLVVGGIGIMNIMLVSVTERTREIGVRMAVGANRLDILGQFLIESSVISLLGGAFGVALGYAMSDLLESVIQVLKTYTPMVAVVWALAMAILTGILSGIYPAYKASRLDPVEALRYE